VEIKVFRRTALVYFRAPRSNELLCVAERDPTVPLIEGSSASSARKNGRTKTRSRRKRRPRDFRFDHGMPRLVCWVSVLKAPHFNLAEQSECRLFPNRIAGHHLKKSLPNGVASQRRERVRIARRSVGTALEKGILHRSHKFVGDARTVVAKNADENEDGYKISSTRVPERSNIRSHGVPARSTASEISCPSLSHQL
jgi:hypothetical protein